MTEQQDKQTYPLNVPAGMPGYVVRSVQERCNLALQEALSGTLPRCQDALLTQLRNEVDDMRRAYDGGLGSTCEWRQWGTRTVTRACEDAVQLAKFRDALARPDVSHVTHGHPVNPRTYHVYRRDNSSPSGCALVASAGHDLPGVETVLMGRSTEAGALRGNFREVSR